MRWTAKMARRIRKIYPNMGTRSVAKAMGLPYSVVKAYASNHGLKKDPAFNRMEERKLSRRKVKYVIDHYTEFTNHDLAKRVGCHESTIHTIKRTHGLSKKNEGCFKKGHRPANFRKRRPGYAVGNMAKTQFKKGQVPNNTLYDGAITIRRDHVKDRAGKPYYWIRIAPGKWIMLHRYLWEEKNGPVPAGYVVIFRDGDSMNCVIDNLSMITMAENARRNSKPEIMYKHTQDLTDSYVAGLLARGKGGRGLSNIIKATAPELIKAKRTQLKLNRIIKHERHNKDRKNDR